MPPQELKASEVTTKSLQSKVEKLSSDVAGAEEIDMVSAARLLRPPPSLGIIMGHTQPHSAPYHLIAAVRRHARPCMPRRPACATIPAEPGDAWTSVDAHNSCARAALETS